MRSKWEGEKKYTSTGPSLQSEVNQIPSLKCTHNFAHRHHITTACLHVGEVGGGGEGMEDKVHVWMK